MLHRRYRALWIALALVVAAAAKADDIEYGLDGHVKGRLVGQTFSDDSIFNSLTGSSALDMESDLRLNFEADRDRWSMRAAYQLVVLFGDRVEYSRLLPPTAGLVFDRLPTDRRRLFGLTDVIHDEDKLAILHRLDRLWVGYTSDKTVLRFGRQAISWGNGFFFSPMDLINPFDPAAIDTEYKPGDDMLYGQYLRDNGHDIQGAVVVRRDVLSGDVESDQATFSAKYHGIVGDSEFDLLLAQSHGDAIVGIGGNRSIGGAVWRGDIVVTDTDSSTEFQLVTNLSYSWNWLDRNMSGVIEYYYNGFGQSGGDYDPASLASNPELLQRLARGELFTLGRHYIAGGVTIELSPLWTLTPNVFANVEDSSALLQIVTQNNLHDNVTFLAALNVPIGSNDTEYGGIETGVAGQFLSYDLSVFAQLAWYF